MAIFTLTAGPDSLTGSAAADTFNVTNFAHFGAADFVIGGAGIDTLVFSGTTGILVLEDRVDEVELVTLGGVSAINVDASGGLTALTITGNVGANGITGTFLADTITGGAGLDTLSGGGGNDVFLVSVAGDMTGDAVNGGSGIDVLRFTGATGTLVLGASVFDLEQVVIGTAAGVTSGTAALNVDASLVSYGLSITGNAGANVLTGTAYDDTLVGGGGNDVFIIKDDLHHGAGETIDGGAGTNTIRFTSTTPTDVLALSANITGIAEVELSDAAGVNTGTAAIGVDASALSTGMLFTGNAGVNEITATAGNDTIDGGAGSDGLDGGGGNDIFVIAAAADHAAGEGIDGGAGTSDTIRFASVVAGQTLALQAGVTGIENIVLASAAGVATVAAVNINATASTENLNITGNVAANALTGGAGNDTITGGAGADLLNGGLGDDLFLVGAVADIPATESVIGGAAGNDILRYTGTTAATLTLGATQLSGVEAVEIASALGVFTGTTAINVNAAAMTTAIRITGNDGANTLTGGTGADTLEGGGGNDVFVIGNAAQHALGEVIDGGAGTADAIQFAATTAGQTLVLRAGVTNVESVVITSALAQNVDATALTYGITLTGNALANTITGSAFNDTITGGAGTDVLAGGDGNDLFVVAAVADLTAAEAVNGGDGSDTLRLAGAGTYALTENISNVEQVAAAAGVAAINVSAVARITGIRITGNDAANTLTGGAGNDTLEGGVGNDVFVIGNFAHHGAGEVIDGGAGTADTIQFTSATAGQTLTLQAGVTGVENVAITSLVAQNVNAAALTYGINLTGNAVANTITGSGFNDTITGGAGTDALNGGAGNDLFVVAAVADLTATEVVNGGADIDTLRLAGAGLYTLTVNVTNLERVEAAAGAAAININASALAGGIEIAGNTAANTLTGGGGNDTLIGGAAADSLVGGDGNDIFLIGSGADLPATETIAGGGGIGDTIRFTSTTAGDTLTLRALVTGIEAVAIADAAGNESGTVTLNVDASLQTLGLTIVGNDGANVIAGGSGGDALIGGDGADFLAGMSGADSIRGDAGGDTLTGGAGSDTLWGGAGADIVKGGMGNDTLEIAADSELVAGDEMHGGSGTADVIKLTGGGQTLDLTTLANSAITGVEIFDLSGTGDNTLVLAPSDVLALGVTTLRIDGDAGDAVQPGVGWVTGATAGGYTAFTHADALGVTLQVSTIVADGFTNDAPVLTGDLAATVAEGGSYTITGTDLGYTDADDVDAGVTFTVSTLTNGAVQVGGFDVTTFTGTQLVAGDVSFVHDGGETLVASFKVLVEDGDEDVSTPVESTFNLTVTPVTDVLDGGVGNDTLTGGVGNDVFLFNDVLGASNIDTIVDFGGAGAPDLDVIHLDDAIFALLTFGALDVANFVAGAGVAAVDADDYILYDTVTGELYYDADGDGVGGAVLFAVIDGAPAGLNEGDFFIV